MIVKANLNDVLGIMEIIGETIKEMRTYNNTQWDETYPKAEDFKKDIESGCLYVDKEDNIIRGFICVNGIEPVEYNDLNWSSNQECMVVHRMAVNSNMRNIGVGTKLMKFADELASSKGIKYLKTDTYSLNKKMNSLFKKCGYKFVGEMSFLGKEFPFYCYDKLLND